MPAGSAASSRISIVLLSVGGLVAALAFARNALGDTVFLYDEAGHLLSVRDSETDPEACGNPPASCPSDPHGDPVCTEGSCGLECDPGWTDAGGRCADTSSDATACGPDMSVCSVPEHGTARCVQGVCGAFCDAGYVASGSACVSLTSDPNNCGSIGRRCSRVPGYATCCSASQCGASDGTACVNVSTDPLNCGWIGHVCGPVGASPPRCSSGRCAKATGTPRVDRVNGVAPSGRVFRSPFWSGLTLSGANLDRVTWVELEVWGADTVDGTPDGVQSVPSAREATLPTGSGGPTIHFQQSPTTLVIDAASLEFQSAFDPGFATRHWLKVKVHYTSSGQDRSIRAEVAVSLTDLVSQGLRPPTITGIASYETGIFASYDPATGLLSLYGDDPGWSVSASSVMSPDLQREFPVLRVAPEGLYLARGLDGRQVGTRSWDGSIETLIVFPYDPAVSSPLMASRSGLIVRGSDLWDDGPLRFTDAVGNVVGGDAPVALFAGNRIVTSVPVGIDRRSAFLELASMRGVGRTPWMLEFVDWPTVSRIEWSGRREDLDNSTGCFDCFEATLPVGEVMTLTGRWLGEVDRMGFSGPANAWVPYAPHFAQEALRRVYGTPGPNEFWVLDDEHIELRIDARPSNDEAHRVSVSYCDCNGMCWDYRNMNLYKRTIAFEDSGRRLGGSIDLNPAVGRAWVEAECGANRPEPSFPITSGVTPTAPGPGDCTNSICP